MPNARPALLFGFLALLSLEALMADSNERRLFIGSQTRLGGKGIYALSMNRDTGALGPTNLAAAAENPTFIARHPKGDFIYAVAEVANRDGGGAVSAFKVDAAAGTMVLLNTVPSGGKGPCHVSVEGEGRVAFCANYGSGALASMPIGADGRLGAPATVIQDQGTGPNAKRQAGPHAHSIRVDPSGDYVFACDLGIDKVLSFRLDRAAATLAPNEPPFFQTHPGAGPRHFAFHPSGNFFALANELDSTVTVCRYGRAKGVLTARATASALPKGVDGSNNTLSEIAFHPSGRFFYTANRGHDSIAVFETGDPSQADYKPALLEAIPCGGKVPRHFAISPDGRFLISANQNSGNLAVLAIDPGTGRLKPTGVSVEMPGASCVLFY